MPRRTLRSERSNRGGSSVVSMQSGGGGGPVVMLSAATVADTATVGTVIGTLSVVGGTGAYTFTLTSNPGALFSITTTSLKVAAALTAGSDPITVQANNGAGSIVSRAFLITVTSTAVALKADFSAPGNESWFFY